MFLKGLHNKEMCFITEAKKGWKLFTVETHWSPNNTGIKPKWSCTLETSHTRRQKTLQLTALLCIRTAEINK